MALLSETRLQPAEVAARIAEHYAADDSHGYSQPNRYGYGSETVDLGDGTLVTIPCGDVDCSKLAINCYDCQDISTGGATYTLDMWELLGTGNFVEVPVYDRKRGDILNTTANRHAAVYVGDGMLVEAYMSESGGISGQEGDQTGWEVRLTDYYDDDWTACYRCTVRRDVSGWVQHENGKWWYAHEDGSYAKDGWEHINGEWYHFDSEGWMTTGWVRDEGHWFFCDLDSGAMRTGWVLDDGKWYYLSPRTGDPRGAMYQDRFAEINGKWYAFDRNGAMYASTRIEVPDTGAIKI